MRSCSGPLQQVATDTHSAGSRSVMSSQTGMVDAQEAAVPIPAPRKFSWAWLGVLPFFVFAAAFLVLPAVSLFVGSFQDRAGNFTLENISGLTQPFILDAYWLSIRVSFVTAVGGALFGFLLAYATILGGLPPFMRSI